MQLGSQHWVLCLERGHEALPSKKKKKGCVYFAVLMVIQRAWMLKTRRALFFQTMPLHLRKKIMFFLGHTRLVFCIWPLDISLKAAIQPWLQSWAAAPGDRQCPGGVGAQVVVPRGQDPQNSSIKHREGVTLGWRISTHAKKALSFPFSSSFLQQYSLSKLGS